MTITHSVGKKPTDHEYLSAGAIVSETGRAAPPVIGKMKICSCWRISVRNSPRPMKLVVNQIKADSGLPFDSIGQENTLDDCPARLEQVKFDRAFSIVK